MKRTDKFSVAVFISGFVLAIFGFVFGFAIYPVVFDNNIRDTLDLWNAESDGRKNFESPTFPVYVKFYLYHVRNPENIISGLEKPFLEEKGPYTYIEKRKKVEVSGRNVSDCFIRAGQNKLYVFNEDQSCSGCKADDNLILINAPLVGLVSLLKANTTLHPFLSEINSVIKNGYSKPDESDFDEDYKDSLFINTSANAFIFGGYKHGVIRWVIEHQWETFGSLLSPQVQQDNGYALYNGKNNTAKNEYYEIDTAYCSGSEADYDSSDLSKYLEIRQWGPQPDMLKPDLNDTNWWKVNGGYLGSNVCNKIVGTLDGLAFHAKVERDETLSIFSTDFCRSLQLTGQAELEVEEIPVIQFAPPYSALQVNTIDNIGFCMENEEAVDWENCIKVETENPFYLNLTECFSQDGYRGTCMDGTQNIASCQKNAPIILSYPHFYQSPEILQTQFDGISKPDPILHETRIFVEPNTGMVIKKRKKFQMNLQVINEPAIEVLSKINTTNLFPMIWLDEVADIDQESAANIKKNIVTPARIVTGVKWVCGITGIVMILGVLLKHGIKR